MASAELTEKSDEASSSPSETADLDLPLHATKELEAIAPSTTANSRSNSLAFHPRSLRSVSRIRSNNGYGCDDGEESLDDGTGGDVEAGAVEKDPFEVRWEEGVESDAMSPRTMAFARKWLVVIVVSMSSLCV